MANFPENDRVRLLDGQTNQGDVESRGSGPTAETNPGVGAFSSRMEERFAGRQAQPIYDTSGFNNNFHAQSPTVQPGYMMAGGFGAPVHPHTFALEQSQTHIYGRWRDGLCECCGPGGCPTFWLAFSGPECFWPCLFAKISRSSPPPYSLTHSSRQAGTLDLASLPRRQARHVVNLRPTILLWSVLS